MVLTHARALLHSSHEGATAYIDADVTDPDRILAAAAETLDFSRPVALILSNILGHVADYGQARSTSTRSSSRPRSPATAAEPSRTTCVPST